MSTVTAPAPSAPVTAAADPAAPAAPATAPVAPSTAPSTAPVAPSTATAPVAPSTATAPVAPSTATATPTLTSVPTVAVPTPTATVTPATATLMPSSQVLETVHSVPEVDIPPEFEGAIELALKNLGDTYDISTQPELLKCLVDNLRLAFSQIKLPSGSNKKTRGTSGYNEYIKSRWEEFRQAKRQAKENGTALDSPVPPQETMAEFAKDWKSLPKDQQEPFLDLARQKNNENCPNKSKKTRRKRGPMSGYNFYIKKKTAEIKDSLPNMSSTDRMTHISGLWGALSEEQKNEYKHTAAAEFWAENPDLLAERQQEEAEAARKAQEKAKLDAAALSSIRQPVVPPPPVATTN